MSVYYEEPPTHVRAWVNRRLEEREEQDEEVLTLRLLGMDERQKREHLKTRAWVLIVTAPAWGDFASKVFDGVTPVQGTVGGVVAAMLGGGLLLLRSFIRGGLH